MSAVEPTTLRTTPLAGLAGARILITGGAGFIGSTIADQALRAGVDSIVLIDNLVRGRHENLDTALSARGVEFLVGDIRDRTLLGRAMQGVDVVFHQAALRITQCADDPRAAVDVMATGTLNVVEAACAAGVRRVVAASSASVYGMATEFPTPEQHHAYDNRTLYGAAKLFDEGLLRSYHDMFGLDYVALRYFNVYGPRMDIHGVYTEVLVRWMERIVRGEPLLIFGDGSQTMDFVFIDDVARANLLAAAAPRDRPGLQRRPRGGDEPAAARRSAPASHGQRPAHRVRAGAVGQSGAPPVGRHPGRRTGSRVPGGGRARRRSGRTRGVVAARAFEGGGGMTLIESPSSIGSASIGSASIGSASIDVEEIGTAPIPIMRPVLGDAEVSAVTEVLRSGWVAQGPRVAAFESAFAASVRAAEGVAVSSCTTGLHLALVLAGVGPGDEVVVPSLSFIATTNAVVYTGATPVFADVDLATGNVTAASIGEVITDRTRAVVVVDQAGVPADIEPIRRLCRSLDLAVVEDAACAIGSTHEGAPVGAGGTGGVLVPPPQDPHDGRGRHGHPRRSRPGSPGATPPRARHESERGRSARERRPGLRGVRRDRLQLSDDRSPGGDRAGAVDAAR